MKSKTDLFEKDFCHGSPRFQEGNLERNLELYKVFEGIARIEAAVPSSAVSGMRYPVESMKSVNQ